jgi:hypothetical protein
MAVHIEVVLPGHGVTEALQAVAVELDQSVAHLAIQVIVSRVAVFVFVDASAAEGHLSKQAGIHQLREGSIHGGPTDLAIGDHLLQVTHQFVGIEVIVVTKDLLDNQPALPSDSLAVSLQILSESLHRRCLDIDGVEREIIAHDNAGGALS